MLIGTLAAIGAGASTPLSFLFLGEVIKAFTFNALTSSISTYLFNETVNCSNWTLSFRIQNLSTPENAITCVDNEKLIAIVDTAAYRFTVVAVGTFMCACIQVLSFQMACEHQLFKIRVYYYRAILRQDIGWFDSNSNGELASRLSDDLDKVHEGIGDKLSYFIQFMSTFFGGIVIAFLKSWKVSLLLFGFLPVLAACASFVAKIAESLTAKAQKQYALAGAVAEEVLSSIRTVVAFGGEQREINRYNQHLKEAGLIGVKKGFGNGALMALVFFVFYALYAVVF